ncbi:MAG: stage II sporulation protein D [Clostridia bacterium]|nr:stage II sporulation protein D [Clostridia bacterium]
MKRATLFALISVLLSATLVLFLSRRKDSLPLPEMKVEFSRAAPSDSYDEEKTVFVLENGVPVEMSFHDYLIGVLLGEMPASFSPEALKAQAVAARTFTIHILQVGKHNGAICENAGCCQAYISPEAYLAANGEPAQAVLEQMSQAVLATDGLVLEYDGALIDAVFFSCSGGRTEAAAEVWGSEVPYLQAVDSPGEEAALPFTDEKSVSREAFCAVLSGLEPACDFSKEPWVGTITYTQGGGVDEMELGGIFFDGTALRSAFSLRSTLFTVEFKQDEVIFHTKGFGHRVGMSQYGADAMARNGSSFEDILAYYYQGTELVCYN